MSEREALVADEYYQYRRKQIAEMADWREGFDMTGVSISDADKQAGSPKIGDKIARNPKNHADKWLVAADYFADNFAALTAQQEPSGVREGVRLNRADVLLAYAYMEERNFPDIAACRVIQQAYDAITRAAEQVNAEGQVAENRGDHGLTGGEPVPSAPTPQPAAGVVVPREPLILTLWRASSDRTEPQRQIIGYIDALLAAAKEQK